MRLVLDCLSSLLLLVLCLPLEAQEIKRVVRTACLVVSVQDEFTCNPKFVPSEFSDPLILNTNLVLERTDELKFPIIYTQLISEEPYERTGMKLPELDPNLLVYGGRRFLQEKTNAFSNESLVDELLEFDIGVLYLMGLQTDKQIYQTALAARRRDFVVFVITDATATLNARRQQRFLRKLKRKNIHLISTQKLLELLSE